MQASDNTYIFRALVRAARRLSAPGFDLLSRRHARLNARAALLAPKAAPRPAARLNLTPKWRFQMKEMASLLLATGASSILVGAAAVPLLMSGPARLADRLPQPNSVPAQTLVAPALAPTPRETPMPVPVPSGAGATTHLAYWDVPETTPVLVTRTRGGVTAICLCLETTAAPRPLLMN